MLRCVGCSIIVPQSATERRWQASWNFRVGVDLCLKTKQTPKKHLCRMFAILQHQQGKLFTELFFEKQCAWSVQIPCQEINTKGKEVVSAYAALFWKLLNYFSVVLVLFFVSSFKMGWIMRLYLKLFPKMCLCSQSIWELNCRKRNRYNWELASNWVVVVGMEWVLKEVLPSQYLFTVFSAL